MIDKNGQPVVDPCSWVFQALARTGYYRRPAGYISPEEQAARDTELEARAVMTQRHKAEQARFEAWKTSLTSDDLERIFAGYLGGPREAWLKKVWKETAS